VALMTWLRAHSSIYKNHYSVVCKDPQASSQTALWCVWPQSSHWR